MNERSSVEYAPRVGRKKGARKYAAVCVRMRRQRYAERVQQQNQRARRVEGRRVVRAAVLRAGEGVEIDEIRNSDILINPTVATGGRCGRCVMRSGG